MEQKELAKALFEFHKNIKPIKKDSKNPFFKSTYLSLPNLLESIADPLQKAGLVIAQLPLEGNKLKTILLHAESGQSIESVYDINPIPEYTREKDKSGTQVVHRSSEYFTPQAIGSAITYARRYAICAILSISADEDDDGNAGSGRKPEPVKEVPVPAVKDEANVEAFMGKKKHEDVSKKPEIEDKPKKDPKEGYVFDMNGDLRPKGIVIAQDAILDIKGEGYKDKDSYKVKALRIIKGAEGYKDGDDKNIEFLNNVAKEHWANRDNW